MQIPFLFDLLIVCLGYLASIGRMLLAFCVLFAIIAILNFLLNKNYPLKDSPKNKDYEMTYIEKRMYNALLRAGYNPIPQYPYLGYYLDFAIIKDGIRLNIECDGKDSHSSPEQKAHDRKRNRVLRRSGWDVVRFSGKQINGNVYSCVEKVKKILNEY